MILLCICHPPVENSFYDKWVVEKFQDTRDARLIEKYLNFNVTGGQS